MDANALESQARNLRKFPFAPRAAVGQGRPAHMSDIPADITHDQHAVRRQKLAELRAARDGPLPGRVQADPFLGRGGRGPRRRPGQHGRRGGRRPPGDHPRHGQEPVCQDPRPAGRASALSQEGRPRRRRLRRVQEARPRRHRRGQGHPLQDQGRRDHRPRRILHASSPRRCGRCPRSGTGLPTPSRCTASATWT